MHCFKTLDRHELYETQGGHMPLPVVANALLLPTLLGVGVEIASGVGRFLRSVAGLF